MIYRFKTIRVFMSHLFFAWAWLYSAQAESEISADETAPLLLTLESALARLNAQNPALLFERESVQRALADRYQVRAELLPQISVTGQQTRQRLGSSYMVAPGQGNPSSSFRTRIELKQVLFDGVKISRFGASGIAHRVASQDYKILQQDLLQLVQQLYYSQLRDQQRIDLLKRNIERYQQLLELAQSQYEAGATTVLDVTRAQVRLATQRRTLMQAGTQAQDSLLQLKSLLDIGLERALQIDRSGFLKLMSGNFLDLKPDSLASALQRPELIKQQQSLAQSKITQRASAWKRLPTVEAFGDWGYDSDEGFDQQQGEAWLLGIRASIPIFDGGRIAAEQREARAAVRQKQHRLRQVENELQREFHFARIDLASRYAQIEIAGDEMSLGAAEVIQAEQRYRAGAADNRALIDARQALADAEESHLEAVYAYALSRIAFARATGNVARDY